MQQSGVLNSTKIHQFDQKTVAELSIIEFIPVDMKMSAAAACCTGRRGLGLGFMARSYEGDMSPRYAHPGQWSPPHCVGTRVTLSSSDADC